MNIKQIHIGSWLGALKIVVGQVGQYISYITLVFASINPETYEKIHAKGSFKSLLDSIAFVKEIKDNGTNIKVIRIIALMNSNYYVLGALLADSRFDFDETWILPVHSSDGRHDLLRKENIFGFPHLIRNREFVTKTLEFIDTQPTRNHVLYIESLLPKTKLGRYITSTRTYITWPLRLLVLSVTKHPKARRLAKMIKQKLA